jgi:hypothetical protein
MFNQAIGLGVKGCGGDVDNVEESGEIGPNLGCELRSPVGCDGVWQAEPGDPVSAEGLSAGRCGGGGKGNRLRPARGAVHDGEDVGVALGRWKWTNKINVQMGKLATRNGNVRRRRVNMFVDFCFLAEDTFSSPPCDIGSQGMPDKSRGKEAPGCPNAGMT